MTVDQAEILLEELNTKIDNGLEISPEVNQKLEELQSIIESND